MSSRIRSLLAALTPILPMLMLAVGLGRRWFF